MSNKKYPKELYKIELRGVDPFLDVLYYVPESNTYMDSDPQTMYIIEGHPDNFILKSVESEEVGCTFSCRYYIYQKDLDTNSTASLNHVFSTKKDGLKFIQDKLEKILYPTQERLNTVNKELNRI